MFLYKLLILKKLLNANTHLGAPLGAKAALFQADRRDARTQSYIYGFRAAQPIFDLDQTVSSLRRACNVIQLIIRSNGHLLFVNTNLEYNKIIQQTAKRTNQSFINHKWIGGFLTNWNHMQHVQQQFQAAATMSSIARTDAAPFTPQTGVSLRSTTLRSASPNDASLRSRRSPNGARDKLTCSPGRRPPVAIDTLRASLCNAPRFRKMQKCFEGCRQATSATSSRAPDCVIILNANQNSTAIYEAHLNQIPIISIVDSNIPNDLYNLITYPIPANDESLRFIYLVCNCFLKTILLSRGS